MATELDVRAVGTSDPTASALLNAYASELHERFVAREPERVETHASEYEEPGGELFHVDYMDGRVAVLRLPAGRTFRFAFEFSDPIEGPSRATVVAPDGAITRIDIPGTLASK